MITTVSPLGIGKTVPSSAPTPSGIGAVVASRLIASGGKKSSSSRKVAGGAARVRGQFRGLPRARLAVGGQGALERGGRGGQRRLRRAIDDQPRTHGLDAGG